MVDKVKMSISELQGLVMKQAKEKGFGIDLKEISVSEKIALIHTEVSEAYDAYRHKNFDGKDGFNEELADIILRVLHLSGVFGIDIEKVLFEKFEFNENRSWDWDKMNETNSNK